MAQNNYQVMSLEAIKYLCSVIKQTVDLPSTVISDTTLATNTTFSSVHIDSEMTNLENEIKNYLNTALAGLNKLTKEVINDKALVTKDNVLYLYKADDDTSNNYMQMMLINGAVVELGNTQVDMDNYYSETEVDDKFALKIDLETLTTSFNDLKDKVDNVLTKDQLVTSIIETATDEEVPTAKAVLDYSYGVEIATSDVIALYGNDILTYPVGIYRFSKSAFTKDNIINLPKDETAGILTVESISPTKAITNSYCYRTYTFNSYKNRTYIRKANTGTNTGGTFAEDTGWKALVVKEDITPAPFVGLPDLQSYYGLTKQSTTIKELLKSLPTNVSVQFLHHNNHSVKLTDTPSYYGSVSIFKTADASTNVVTFVDYVNNVYTYSYHEINDSETGWQSLCKTKVADVGKKTLTLNSTYCTGGNASYVVQNGICFVQIWGVTVKGLTTSGVAMSSGMPKAKVTGSAIGAFTSSGLTTTVFARVPEGDTKLYISALGTAQTSAQCDIMLSFSYPVAE